jgi:hypothetical protein
MALLHHNCIVDVGACVAPPPQAVFPAGWTTVPIFLHTVPGKLATSPDLPTQLARSLISRQTDFGTLEGKQKWPA